MHPLFSRSFKPNSTLRLPLLWRVFWSCLASFNPPSQGKRLFVRKKTNSLKRYREFRCCHHDRVQHRLRYCAVHVYYALNLRVFRKWQRSRVGCKENSAARHLTRVYCSADKPGCNIRWQALNAKFRGSRFTNWKALCATLWRKWFRTVTADTCPGFDMIAAAEEEGSLSAWLGSQLYVFYTTVEKRILENTLQTEHIIVPAFSVFVCHSHLQHAGAGGEGCSRSLYQAYFIPFHVFPKDAISIA